MSKHRSPVLRDAHQSAPMRIDEGVDGRLSSGLADECGIPRIGRRAEHDDLRAAGARDLAWGRLFEGHVNALQLIGRLGSDLQREQAVRDANSGVLHGVWNTEEPPGVRVVEAGDAVVLAGRKTFASGAGRVARAVITAGRHDGASQLVIVPMDRVSAVIDESFWRPYGMQASDSFAVSFDGVRLGRSALLGNPDDYQRNPWLLAGASRFVAVQTGGIERLVGDLGSFLTRRERNDDVLALERLGRCAVAARTAVLWTDACAEAWMRYDGSPSGRTADALVLTVDSARNAVERCALDVAECVERGVGARGLLETEPFARRLRDLRMYLRQPAIDDTLLRVARSSLISRAMR